MPSLKMYRGGNEVVKRKRVRSGHDCPLAVSLVLTQWLGAKCMAASHTKAPLQQAVPPKELTRGVQGHQYPSTLMHRRSRCLLYVRERGRRLQQRLRTAGAARQQQRCRAAKRLLRLEGAGVSGLVGSI